MLLQAICLIVLINKEVGPWLVFNNKEGWLILYFDRVLYLTAPVYMSVVYD